MVLARTEPEVAAVARAGLPIRLAAPSDAASVARHRRLMFDEMGLASGEALERVEHDTRAALVPAMREGDYRHWFAEDAGKIVAGAGVILARWLPMPEEPALRRATVLNVYTEPAYRRRGHARRLMYTVIAWCRAQGFAFVQLHASDDGRPLYESLGFKPTNEMRLILRP